MENVRRPKDAVAFSQTNGMPSVFDAASTGEVWRVEGAERPVRVRDKCSCYATSVSIYTRPQKTWVELSVAFLLNVRAWLTTFSARTPSEDTKDPRRARRRTSRVNF